LNAAVAFGRVLRRLRNEAGLTQEKLGFEANLRRTYISILELGHQQPTLTTILKLAKPLKSSAKDIVGMVESEMRHAGPRRR
jgi:transcriptional regulator with XRE-family HTH domain